MSSVYKFVKASVLASALAAVPFAASAYIVGLPLTIQETGVGISAKKTQFDVDRLNGQYDEVVTFLDATHFTTTAIFKAGSWYKDGDVAQTHMNNIDNGYGLYAKFIASGTYSVDGFGKTSFNATNNAIQLFVDRDQDTKYKVGAVSTGAYGDLTLSAGSTADDTLLGSAVSTGAAGGSSNPAGTAKGDFRVVFDDWALSATGQSYFIKPSPFYMVLDLNGNFNSFNPVAGTSVQLLNNSANASWGKVPEPASLALVGVALLAVGVATKRRKA